MECTHSNSKPVEITSEALMDSVKKMAIYHRPHIKSKHPKLFERLMNRFGWHRNPEIFVVKDSSFRVTP